MSVSKRSGAYFCFFVEAEATGKKKKELRQFRWRTVVKVLTTGSWSVLLFSCLFVDVWDQNLSGTSLNGGLNWNLAVYHLFNYLIIHHILSYVCKFASVAASSLGLGLRKTHKHKPNCNKNLITTSKKTSKINKTLFFRCFEIDIYCKSVMETLFAHLRVTGRDIMGSHDQFTSSKRGLVLFGSKRDCQQKHSWQQTKANSYEVTVLLKCAHNTKNAYGIYTQKSFKQVQFLKTQRTSDSSRMEQCLQFGGLDEVRDKVRCRLR